MDNIEKNINDILDVEGKNNNFLTDKPFSPEYVKLASKWSKLPMYADKISVKKFFDLLHNCQIILLISGTGSGKTVLVPKFFLKYVKTMGLGGKVAITNPKILTTLYNAEYGAKTLDVELGEEVGYRFKGAPFKSSNRNSKLMYVTDGLILATILSGDSILSEYQGIIIDEAHERHVQIDMLLKLIKEILPLRPDFKLIIMSATINAAIFRNYFANSANTKISYGEMEVSGESNYPITQNWLDPKIKINRGNYLDLAIDRCLNILDTTETGDIIIFVPTQNDAIKGCQNLKHKCPDTLKTKKTICDKLYCVEVFSKMKQANKNMAVSKDLYKTKGFDRKVIFATNVAESSITFDGLVYVIETGFELANYYEVNDNSYVISKNYTSQAQIKQRIGRAGRTQPGVSYHLYTLQSFNSFKLYPEPNISVIDLTDFVLSLTKYSKTIRNLIPIIKGLITIPKIEQITYAMYKLHFTKCLKLIDGSIKTKMTFDTDSDDSDDSDYSDNSSTNLDDSDNSSTNLDSDNSSTNLDSDSSTKSNTSLIKVDSIKWDKIRSYDKMLEMFNGTLTTVGINVLKFKSSPLLSALSIIMAKYMNCLDNIVILMAILEISDGKLNSIFEIDRKETDKIIKYFSKSAINGSDHLTVLNIYNEHYLKQNYKYLNRRSFNNIEKRASQLLTYAKSISEASYTHMKTKYKLIQHSPYENTDTNILYVLGYSHYYNLLQKEANNIYTSINLVDNSIAPLEYFVLSPPVKTQTNFVIFHSLSNVFGRKSFQCLSQIPDSIIADIMESEDTYFNHKISLKNKKTK
jgi:HrpA-like RNA helicase